MDEISKKFKLTDLIIILRTTLSNIEMIHLLTDEEDKYIIAVNWDTYKGKEFKMFRQQSKPDILSFCDFLSEKHLGCDRVITQWFDRPHIPLKLQPQSCINCFYFDKCSSHN